MATQKSYSINEGDSAPNFILKSHRGEEIQLSDFHGKYVVLYFYPKDNTPGCTMEAREFSNLLPQFEAKNAVVLGVSPDSIDSHCSFADKYQLGFHLLSDDGHKVAEKYEVWGEKNMYGKITQGIIRSTFLIGPDGKVVRVWRKVKPEGHAQKVLESIHL
jgi:peroxiredoxin Q/BCP